MVKYYFFIGVVALSIASTAKVSAIGLADMSGLLNQAYQALVHFDEPQFNAAVKKHQEDGTQVPATFRAIAAKKLSDMVKACGQASKAARLKIVERFKIGAQVLLGSPAVPADLQQWAETAPAA